MSNPSYWMGTGPRTDYPPYRPDGRPVDVAVVGCGVTGLTVALLLAQSGAGVTVVEAGELAAGVTGFTTAKVTSLHGLPYRKLTASFGADAAAVYAEANQAGLDEIVRLVADLGIDCDLERLPAFTYTEQVASVSQIEGEVEAAIKVGLPAAFTTETDLPYPVAGAIRLEDQAQLHPRRYCLGLAAAMAATGGSVHEHTRVLDIDDGRPVSSRPSTVRSGPATSSWPPSCRSSIRVSSSPGRTRCAPMRSPSPSAVRRPSACT